MSDAKQEALRLIERLPDSVSLDTIVAELEFKLLIECRLAEIERGEVVTHEQALESISKWLTSVGTRAPSAT